MLSITEAKELTLQHALEQRSIDLPLTEAAGKVLAVDINCPIDLPPFRSSSMDGFAVHLVEGQENYRLVGETPAGAPPGPKLLAGEARRIFTGAAVPPAANVVVMQEQAVVKDDEVKVELSALAQGKFIREIGSAIASGDPALSAGMLLGPGSLGLLASMGMAEVSVFDSPKIAIIGSGDELIKPGLPLAAGQIYESNSYALEAAVSALKPATVYTQWLPDDEAQIQTAIAEALTKTDLLVLCGGISVGAYDFVGKVLRKLGTETVFYKVAQKPGKPLFFGKMGAKRIFALPGNPASALVCFYEYVYPFIRAMQGLPETGLSKTTAQLNQDLAKRYPRPSFERATYSIDETGGKWVAPLAGQESYQMKALALANALLVLPEGEHQFKKGDEMEVHLLP